MATIIYSRVSTKDQSVDVQEQALLDTYQVDKSFSDAGVSGSINALEREGFRACYEYLREGDTLIVAAVDRLGRNTIDILNTVEALKAKGVSVISKREGFDLSTPIGKAMLTMLSAVAELERSNIKARQLAGINRAKSAGIKLGRKQKANAQDIKAWRESNKASLAATASHFGLSKATICNYLKDREAV